MPLLLHSAAYARRRDSACQNRVSRPPRTHSGFRERGWSKINDSLESILIHDIRGSNRGAPRQNVGAERDDDES